MNKDIDTDKDKDKNTDKDMITDTVQGFFCTR
jgi:hypothetical protein